MTRIIFISVLSSALSVATAAFAQAEAQPQADTGPLVERPLPAREDAPDVVLRPVKGGLTSDEVARRTLATSATVRARQAELDAANAKIRQTTIMFFPRVTLKAQYTRLSPVAADFGSGALVGARNPGLLGTGPCPSGVGTCVLDAAGEPVGAAPFEIETFEDNYSLSASIVVPLSDYVTRLSHAAAASAASRQAARTNIEAERLKVQTEARVLYFGWVRAVGQVAVAQKSLERSRARLKDAEAAYTLGTISKADLLRLQALVSNTEFAVKEAETLYLLGAEQLRILMGQKGDARFQVGEDVLSPIRNRFGGNLSALTAEALRRRLELAAMHQTARSLRRGGQAAGAARWPRLDAFGDITYANPNQRFFPPQQEWNATWAVGLSATWTINETFTGNAAQTELEANARVVEAQRVALQNGIRQEVAATYLDREKARVAIETSDRAASAAEEAYRVATDLYRVGRATTTELIEAEADLLNARLAQLSARIGLRIADVRLEHAIGRDVRTR